MAAAEDSPADSRPETETTARRPRAQAQLDFEIDFLGRVLDRDPCYPEALRVHAMNLAAKGLHRRALALDRRLSRLLPDRPTVWYNLACTYAVLGRPDPAFDALGHAIALGYRRLRRLCSDPDLRSLRPDPRFARLVREAVRGRC
ncbi:MAG TPA: hypothetical protein VG406_19115 [Isosphaeraceae bacterium]|jgi:tetratricopeptide (TPR) repeat protein|nr:hypothetical protein [Isosphaeraceae bacterium]